MEFGELMFLIILIAVTCSIVFYRRCKHCKARIRRDTTRCRKCGGVLEKWF